MNCLGILLRIEMAVALERSIFFGYCNVPPYAFVSKSFDAMRLKFVSRIGGVFSCFPRADNDLDFCI